MTYLPLALLGALVLWLAGLELETATAASAKPPPRAGWRRVVTVTLTVAAVAVTAPRLWGLLT